MSTAASVPQLMIVASCHHRFGYATSDTFRSLISSQLMKYDVEMHKADAIQISRVNGCSKSNSFFPLYIASEIAWLTKYDTPDMKSIRKRMAKIQTISLACRSGWVRGIASTMKAIRATPVTP